MDYCASARHRGKAGGEIVGLRREDVLLDAEVPHILIRPYEALGRTLKTPGSERAVPLLGLSHWAAKQAMAASGGSDWLFPRYASDGDIRATHASNTVNKWIRGTLGIKKTTHSARHSMRDLLRNSGCSEEIAKALLGHGSRSVADSYGAGFTLQRLKEALEKVIR
jgi:integrase